MAVDTLVARLEQYNEQADNDSDLFIPDGDNLDEQLGALSASDVTFPLTPRDYQVEAIEFLRSKKRAMCTDDAGLGKTLSASEAMVTKLPGLVACPTYLMDQWYDHLTQQYPGANVGMAAGSRNARTKTIRTKNDFTIVNHQMFRGYIMPEAGTLVVDEAHHFRNRGADQTKLLYQYVEQDTDMNVFLLTASPVYTTVDNLWSMFHILQPDIFPSYKDFVEMYCVTTFDRYEGVKVVRSRPARRKELEKLLNILRIGRTYKDVGRHLPRIIGRAVKVTIPEDVMALYRDLRYRYKITMEAEPDDPDAPKMFPLFSASAVMHSLRAVTAPGKVRQTANLLMDIPKSKKTVIFCWYKDTAQQMYDEVVKRQRRDSSYRPGKVVVITGDTPKLERRQLAMSADTCIATIGSLSEGVNLYHMRAVIFLEEHYSPGANYQALRRVQRDRNDDGVDRDPILVYYMYVPKTADEAIHKLSRSRTASAKDVLKEIFQTGDD